MNGVRWLALGDSYTVGEGVAAAATWPAQLVAALATAGVVLAPADVVATTGWTTDELAHALDVTPLAPPYALVSLSIGVNDQYRGRDAASFHAGFVALLERAIGYAGARPRRVMVVSIPDWGVTRFAREQGRDRAAVGADIDTFNALAQSECARLGARFVDVTAASRAAGDAEAMLTADGLHPSAAQYARWLPAIETAARACLES